MITKSGICIGESLLAKSIDGTADACTAEETVGSVLDIRITNTRFALEQLCILKAKAEAMQMLDKPMNFMRQLTW